MFVPGLFLLCSQIAVRPFEEPSDWQDVPAVVAEEVIVAGGNWKAENGWRNRDKNLCVEGWSAGTDVLEVQLTNYNGYSGVCAVFRLSTAVAGGVTVQVSSSWSADLGPDGGGPNLDLHGDVLIQKRSSGDGPQPLNVSFRLNGIHVGYGDLCFPWLTEGQFSLDVDSLNWDPTIRATGPGAGLGRVPKERLTEVSTQWPDGKLRSHGWTNPRGRRQGLWRTWDSDGNKQTESEFLDGERAGRWKSFDRNGRLFETGRLRKGLRDGKWAEERGAIGKTVVHTGHYVAGLKEGEWVSRRPNGKLQARGKYEHGQETGLWTRWWPNGKKSSEGRKKWGYSKGEWTFWAEDGSLKEVVVKKLPPWAREYSGR